MWVEVKVKVLGSETVKVGVEVGGNGCLVKVKVGVFVGGAGTGVKVGVGALEVYSTDFGAVAANAGKPTPKIRQNETKNIFGKRSKLLDKKILTKDSQIVSSRI